MVVSGFPRHLKRASPNVKVLFICLPASHLLMTHHLKLTNHLTKVSLVKEIHIIMVHVDPSNLREVKCSKISFYQWMDTSLTRDVSRKFSLHYFSNPFLHACYVPRAEDIHSTKTWSLVLRGHWSKAATHKLQLR